MKLYYSYGAFDTMDDYFHRMKSEVERKKEPDFQKSERVHGIECQRQERGFLSWLMVPFRREETKLISNAETTSRKMLGMFSACVQCEFYKAYNNK